LTVINLGISLYGLAQKICVGICQLFIHLVKELKQKGFCCFNRTNDELSVGIGIISSWDWNVGGKNSSYRVLFPHAWRIYEGVIFLLHLD